MGMLKRSAAIYFCCINCAVALLVAPGHAAGAVNEISDLGDNRSAVVTGIGLVVLLVYYALVWVLVGRDPKKDTIIPAYKPPARISPAAVGYIVRNPLEDRGLAAAILSMAVKGYLAIEQSTPNDFVLRKTGQVADLSPDEVAVADKLFGGVLDEVPLKQENRDRFLEARDALLQTLVYEIERTYFLHNKFFLLPGIVMTVATLILTVGMAPSPGMAGFFLVAILFLLTFAVRKLSHVWTAKRLARSVGNFRWTFLTYWTGFVYLAFSLCLLGPVFVLSSAFTGFTSVLTGAGIIGLILVNGFFYCLLKSPSRLGRRILDAIEGYRHYLVVAERDRMNFLNPPDAYPDSLDKHLPYAVALGLDRAWGQRFADVVMTVSETYAEPGRNLDRATA